MRKPALAIVATLLVMLLALPRPHVSSAASPPDVKGRNLDGQLAAIAEHVPGFGGLFFDEDGRPTVYVRDLRTAPAARAAVADFLAGRRARQGNAATAADAGDIAVRRGDYDFARLVEWKGALREVLGRPGVVFVDVDERQNRLLVGVEPGVDLGPVLKLATQRGIPQAAVVVSEVEPMKMMATVRDYV